MSGTADSLTDRYGAPSPVRRVAVAVIGGTIVLAALGMLIWIIIGQSDPAVSSQELTNDIVDDHSATVTVRLQYGDDPVDATCRVRAIAHDKAVVGELTVHPDPADGPDHTFDIATDRRATAVEWLGCTAPGQPRPR